MNVAVVGLGYVGLPLAVILARNGHLVFGIDKDKSKIKSLKNGKLPFAKYEPNLLNFFNKAFKTKSLFFDTEFNKIQKAKVIFIAVDTPIIGKKPNYKSLKQALKSISKFLSKGSIVVVESTIGPKTIQSIVIPSIEKNSGLKVNKDFYAATVPERIRPNHIFEQLTTLSRVIGISDIKIKSPLLKIYSKITSGNLNFTDPTTAEVVKTVENTFRDVNIAFSNEIALACEELGVSVWEVRDLVNKSPFHNLHKPGAGVGGHCIPKDPWLLVSALKKTSLKLVNNSREINNSMPIHIFNLARSGLNKLGKDIEQATLSILGYTYVENSDDTRNSPTEVLAKYLKEKKVRFKIHDPFVETFSKETPLQIARKSDCLIVMVAHKEYEKLDLKRIASLMNTKLIVDGRNAFSREVANRAGFSYFGIGNV